MRESIDRPIRSVLLLLVALLLAAGCGGRYAASGVTGDEKAEIRSALQSYAESMSQAARRDGKGVPGWMALVRQVTLKEAVKMQDGYKALVRLQGDGGLDKARYFLLTRKDGELQVTGVLGR